MENSYCKKYKSSLSRCKDCRKKEISKNNYRKNEIL